MRYFSKEVPKTPIWLPNGDALKFDSFDGRIGYFATGDEAIIQVLKKLEAEHRGGVHEISPEEYDRDYAKKKANSKSFDYNSMRREEIAPGAMPDTLAPPARPVASPAEGNAVSDTPKPAPVPAVPVKAPKVGKRKASD